MPVPRVNDMDVNKTIGPASTLNSGKRLPVDHSWAGALNRAKGFQLPTDLSSKLGVAHEASLATRKMSESTINSAKIAFAKALDQASSDRAPLSEEKQVALEKSSAMLVNQFFMGSMLKQMRDSPFKSDLFNGGKGGDAYAGLFDQHLAEHAGSSIAKSLVKSMVKQYARTASNLGAHVEGLS